MFYTATDGSVWKKEVSGTAIPDSRLGGHLVSGPAAIVSGADDFIVFGQGTDNQLWWTLFAFWGTGPGPGKVELVFAGGRYGIRKRLVSAHLVSR